MVVVNARTRVSSVGPGVGTGLASSLNRIGALSTNTKTAANIVSDTRSASEQMMPDLQRLATSKKFEDLNSSGNFADRQMIYAQAAEGRRQAEEMAKAAAESLKQQQEFAKQQELQFKQALEKAKELGLRGEAMQEYAQNQTQNYKNIQFSGDSKNPRDRIIQSALSLVGTQYELGGNVGSRSSGVYGSKVMGVDCSGLTQYAYRAAGLSIPRYSKSQTTIGHRTSLSKAQPGDIIGWNQGNGVMGHVAIYLGNGMMVEAPQPGKQVRVVPVWNRGSAFAVHLNF